MCILRYTDTQGKADYHRIKTTKCMQEEVPGVLISVLSTRTHTHFTFGRPPKETKPERPAEVPDLPNPPLTLLLVYL